MFVADPRKEHIARGEQFVKGLAEETLENTENLPNRLYKKHCMVDFVWYLRDLARQQQGIEFEEGVFVFPDPGYRIHDFFADIAYERWSTHFQQSRASCLGIDIAKTEELSLPEGHRTCHFGKLKMVAGNRDCMFLKTENYGLGTFDQAVWHSFDWLLTRGYHLIGQASGPNDRKEHLPADVMNEFTKFATTFDLNNSENLALVRAHGIAGINEILNNYLEKHPENQEAREFINQLAKEYGHLPLRKGNEVILTSL